MTRSRLRVLVVGIAAVALAGAILFLWQHFYAGRERDQALTLFRAGRFDEAEPALLRLFERDPNDLTVVVALATGHLNSNRLVADAEPYLSRWCALEPNNPEPFRLRMDLWLRLQRRDRALADGQRVLELEPSHFELRKAVAWLLLSEGRFAEADAECRRCLESHPDSPPLRYLAANIEYLQGHADQAAGQLDPLVASTPPYPPAALLRAVIHLQAQPPEPEPAVPLLRGVIADSADPDDRQKARYYLAQALGRLKRDAEAKQVLDEMQREREASRLAVDSNQQPRNLDLRVRAAAALLDVGKAEQGLALLQHVLERAPENAAAHAVLADYYTKQGQPDRAKYHRRFSGAGGKAP
jgi:predicted Zn-dependent protease